MKTFKIRLLYKPADSTGCCTTEFDLNRTLRHLPKNEGEKISEVYLEEFSKYLLYNYNFYLNSEGIKKTLFNNKKIMNNKVHNAGKHFINMKLL